MKLISQENRKRNEPALHHGRGAGSTARQERKEGICPFTLEPSGRCTVRKTSFRVRCSYTLEACYR